MNGAFKLAVSSFSVALASLLVFSHPALGSEAYSHVSKTGDIASKKGSLKDVVPFKGAPNLGTVEEILTLSEEELEKKISALPGGQIESLKKEVAKEEVPSGFVDTIDRSSGETLEGKGARKYLENQANVWMFQPPLSEFISFREKELSNPKNKAFVWTTDGCSVPLGMGKSWSKKFYNPCVRHDFGYRNFGPKGPLNLGASNFKKSRKKIDAQFLKDMDSVTKGFAGRAATRAFYGAVRAGGKSHF
ncbi:Prokaryotic phospholipase A2 [Dermatophilus congolensis]|uniref:Prokaryotic phospholipase A2 n=1 Tax=Dermatophilus congolensis TaxID=1863 RepID=A0A239V652_9MICO|nr:phospholipase A2 [Dermatophilus congolensis]SNV17731.1 Prokaryotic phospholipase A2 [Dermatophilus congolensis]